MTDPSEIIKFRVPADWLPAIDAAAAEAGVLRSAWVRSAIVDALPQSVRRELSEPRPEGRQPKSADSH